MWQLAIVTIVPQSPQNDQQTTKARGQTPVSVYFLCVWGSAGVALLLAATLAHASVGSRCRLGSAGALLQTVSPAELSSSGGWVQVCSSTVREAERRQLLPWGWQKYQSVNRSTETGSQFCPHAFGQSKSSDQGQGREVEATLCL